MKSSTKNILAIIIVIFLLISTGLVGYNIGFQKSQEIAKEKKKEKEEPIIKKPEEKEIETIVTSYEVTDFDNSTLKDYTLTSNIITTESEYNDIVTKYNLIPKDVSKTINHDFENYNYVVYALATDSCRETLEYKNTTITDKKLTINFNLSTYCGVCAPFDYVYEIAIPKDIDSSLKTTTKHNLVSKEECDVDIAYKPVLYLYPESTQEITINFSNENLLTTTYPKFNNEWKITANQNGDLLDKNGQKYYALFWEENDDTIVDFSEGFYVSKDNAISFLEEKLSILGLNEKESNEFIMYWLPIIENNKHNLIYFELTEELEKDNKLLIKPKPDTLIRIRMHIKKISNKQNIKEQKLIKQERNGFVAVEWGGKIYK